MGNIPKQATLELKRQVTTIASGLPGTPRLNLLVRVPPPTRSSLQTRRNAPRRGF